MLNNCLNREKQYKTNQMLEPGQVTPINTNAHNGHLTLIFSKKSGATGIEQLNRFTCHP